jgi:hypothetical protein
VNVNSLLACLVVFPFLVGLSSLARLEEPKRYAGALNMNVPHVSTDRTVSYDFDIVYVRAPRREADGRSRWAEVGEGGQERGVFSTTGGRSWR